MPRRRSEHPTDLPTQVVERPEDLAECLDHLRSVSILGFDTEFVGEESFRPELCLIQVSTAERLILIDPLQCGSLDAFWDLFLDPRRTIVVHAGREEVRMCQFAVGAPPAKLFDVQIGSALVGFNYPIGYGGLVHEVIGARMSKGETLTDWRRRPLSASQVKYAYDDVRYLLPLYYWITDKLKKRGRTTWAEEEMSSFVRRAINDDPTVERWRKLKGLGGLSRRELAVAREVFIWRDEFAARLNRPARVLLRDDLIVEIARRGVHQTEELQNLRGLPRGESESILRAVRSAASLPSEDLPTQAERDNDAPHVAILANLLGVVLNEYCARIQLAANLVATSSDLKTLVRSYQPGGKAPRNTGLFTGWRSQAVLPHLEAILAGRAVLRVIDPADPNPIAIETDPAQGSDHL